MPSTSLYAVGGLLLTVLATPTIAVSDSVIDCGPTTRSGFENCVRTIRRVLALLPHRPEKVQVLDPDRATSDVKARLQHVDGFADPRERVVYLNLRGYVLQHALKGAGVWDYVAAIVVWHEMAHIDGAPEVEAQRQEEDLWQQFIVSRKVDGGQGLAYLRLLRKRRELPRGSGWAILENRRCGMQMRSVLSWPCTRSPRLSSVAPSSFSKVIVTCRSTSFWTACILTD
jgi:hypothetical protein